MLNNNDLLVRTTIGTGLNYRTPNADVLTYQKKHTRTNNLSGYTHSICRLCFISDTVPYHLFDIPAQVSFL